MEANGAGCVLAAMLFTAWGADCLNLHHAKIQHVDMEHQTSIIIQVNLVYVPRALLLQALRLDLARHFSP
jgi:hypothetical protein